MRKVEDKIIEVREEVQVGEIILEKGDKVKVLKENPSSRTNANKIIDFVEEIYDINFTHEDYQGDVYNFVEDLMLAVRLMGIEKTFLNAIQ